ncbi:MAG: hypothetical protein IPM46_00240 [Flavobacteriales bacterium]|nr:hypothetical protein [Flavobacteriales bacterium]
MTRHGIDGRYPKHVRVAAGDTVETMGGDGVFPTDARGAWWPRSVVHREGRIKP